MKKFLIAASVAVAFVTLALVGSSVRSYTAEGPACVASIEEVQVAIDNADPKPVVTKYTGEQAQSIRAHLALLLRIPSSDEVTQVWFAYFPVMEGYNIGFFTDTCFVDMAGGVPKEMVEEVLRIAVGQRS